MKKIKALVIDDEEAICELIKDICEDNKLFIIVKTIINFAKELGIDIIVEFVHKKEILEITKDLNITGYQGYYIAEPMENI